MGNVANQKILSPEEIKEMLSLRMKNFLFGENMNGTKYEVLEAVIAKYSVTDPYISREIIEEVFDSLTKGKKFQGVQLAMATRDSWLNTKAIMETQELLENVLES